MATGDINNDGLDDIYFISNMRINKLYLNLGNLKFKDITSSAGVGGREGWKTGVTFVDINADNLLDIYVFYSGKGDPENYMEYALLVMQGFYHSRMRNMLQLNNGNGTFSEIGQLAGVSNTDWSWAPLFADYDNDGWKDLFVTNGYFRDYTNRDFLKYKNDYYAQSLRSKEKADTFQLVSRMTSTPVHNYIFKNNRDLTFLNKSMAWGFEKKGFSTGAAYSDLDNDGDLDLVFNNQNETGSVYRNMLRETDNSSNYLKINLRGSGKNTHGLGSKIYVYTKKGVQFLEQMPSRGYQSSVSTTLHFGLAEIQTIDSIVVEWPGSKVNVLKNIKANQTIEIKETAPKPKPQAASRNETTFSPVKSIIAYEHNEYGSNDFERQKLMLRMLSTWGPIIATGDVNGDMLTDVYAGGAKESPGKLYIQSANGSFSASQSFNFKDDFGCSGADALFLDADKDGDQDLEKSQRIHPKMFLELVSRSLHQHFLPAPSLHQLPA